MNIGRGNVYFTVERCVNVSVFALMKLTNRRNKMIIHTMIVEIFFRDRIPGWFFFFSRVITCIARFFFRAIKHVC